MEKLKVEVKLKNRIRVHMAEVGCRSMKSLSAETGISANMLHLIETGKSSPTVDNVFRLLYFFGCTFEELFQAEITTNEPNHIDALSPAVKESIEAGEAEYLASKTLQKESA
jgi:transcriptional regulator with XRE-family HTH domain